MMIEKVHLHPHDHRALAIMKHGRHGRVAVVKCPNGHFYTIYFESVPMKMMRTKPHDAASIES